MRKAWLAALAVVLVATSCAARNKDEAATENEEGGEANTEESTSEPTTGDKFGDMESPCGPGEMTVEESESAGSPDKMLLGVANDRSSTIRPGLNKELWDTSQAFAAWCNAQGGIGGLEIELVDIDGKLLEVEASMAEACNGVFMLVGGGQVQDNLQFSGKPESDFHECVLADIPGFAVSPEKSESNGQIQPIPHPLSEAPSLWIRQFQQLHPEEAESMVEVWGELPAMETVKEQTVAIFDAEGVENAGVFPYPVTGLADWTPLAQQIIATGSQSLHFVGEPTNFAALVKTLREQGWEGYPVVETNIYDQVYVDAAGADKAADTLIRSIFHPFEEADKWPAVQQYIDILNDNVDDPKIALLGMQSFSGWLLFADSARACGEANDGVVTRDCVLETAAEVDDWTAGGLHAPTNPGPEGGGSPVCGMLIRVTESGEFERYFPEIGSEDDDLDGFGCDDTAVVDVPANAGLGVTSDKQPI
ncbi:MAG: ABC transporter substrate-binding protein [Actinomycetia bacterium]|nr:ABC transporter substrate-binding protein [Actinomycetes bacterium]